MARDMVNLADDPNVQIRLERNDATGNVYAVWYYKGVGVQYYNVTPDYLKLKAEDNARRNATRPGWGRKDQ